MGSNPYLQFMSSNVTAVTGIVKVTTMYRSVVLVRVGLGILFFCSCVLSISIAILRRSLFSRIAIAFKENNCTFYIKLFNLFTQLYFLLALKAFSNHQEDCHSLT
jgi:hypothetical protein